jgi:hypothetical protein
LALEHLYQANHVIWREFGRYVIDPLKKVEGILVRATLMGLSQYLLVVSPETNTNHIRLEPSIVA